MIRARTAVVVAAGVSLALSLPAAGESRRAWVGRRADHVPLRFVEIQGQVDPHVSYSLAGWNTAVRFTDEGFTYALATPVSVSLEFVGTRSGLKPEGRDPTGLEIYSSVVYREVWPGIDLSVDGSSGRLEYSFTVQPGADPRRIRMRYRGADSVRLDGSGALEVATPAGSLSDRPPYAYQEREGREEGVPASYALRRDGPDYVYSFELGRYDRRRTLVIDPVVLAYCGYIGGSDEDESFGIAVDAAGSAYVTGETSSSEATFPVTVGPDLTYNGGAGGAYDVFAAKVKADGTGLGYAGYIGGSGWDVGYGIAVDSAGSAYVTGFTDSAEATFPVVVGPDLTFNGGGVDPFVAKVEADGTGLVYCGYIGDTYHGDGIAVDAAGNAYVTGHTSSSEATFPVAVGPDLTYNDRGDAFVAKVKTDGTGLAYCGYIGGSMFDFGYGIAVDADGSAYVTGQTTSSEATFPVTVGPDLTFNSGVGGIYDAFVAKVKADGTGLGYAGYIGGSEGESEHGIAVDAAGSGYLAGTTQSSEATFPVAVGPDLTFNGGGVDAFVAKAKVDGTGLVYAGYIGGSAQDEGSSIAVDAAGSAYVSGRTFSTEATFPVLDGPDLTYNSDVNSGDAFVAKVKPDGTGLVYAGYIGGSNDDECLGIAVDAAGSAYVTGFTDSTEATFPVAVGPELTYNGGAWDAFVAKVALSACQLEGLAPPGALLGVKDGSGGARFEWGRDPGADQYHLNTVTAKTDLRDTDPTSPRQQPQGQGVTECTVSAPTLSCTDADALADPRRLFYYQLLSACGPVGADEGPMCPSIHPCP